MKINPPHELALVNVGRIDIRAIDLIRHNAPLGCVFHRGRFFHVEWLRGVRNQMVRLAARVYSIFSYCDIFHVTRVIRISTGPMPQ